MYLHVFLLALLLSTNLAFAADGSMAAKFEEQERQYQLPSGVLSCIAKVESGGNPEAKAPCAKCTATGLFQWTDGSWKNYSKLYCKGSYSKDFQQQCSKYGLDINARKNPYIATEVTAYALASARSHLGGLVKGLGEENQGLALYLTHLMGEGGGKALIQQYLRNPDAPAVNALPERYRDSARQNNGKYLAGSTAQAIAEIGKSLGKKCAAPNLPAGYDAPSNSSAGRLWNSQAQSAVQAATSDTRDSNDRAPLIPAAEDQTLNGQGNSADEAALMQALQAANSTQKREDLQTALRNIANSVGDGMQAANTTPTPLPSNLPDTNGTITPDSESTPPQEQEDSEPTKDKTLKPEKQSSAQPSNSTFQTAMTEPTNPESEGGLLTLKEGTLAPPSTNKPSITGTIVRYIKSATNWLGSPEPKNPIPFGNIELLNT